MALVCAADFVDFGCLVQYETLQEEGKLRFLDAVEKVDEFRKHCLLAWSDPDPTELHYQTMRATVCTVTTVANVSLDKVFLWVDFCSIHAGAALQLHICQCPFSHAAPHPPLGPTAHTHSHCCYVSVDILASQEHPATQKLFFATVALYVTLCDFFIVIVPPATHEGPPTGNFDALWRRPRC